MPDIDEIRINAEYAQLLKSDILDRRLKEDSETVPRIRKQFQRTKTYLDKISKIFNKGQTILPPNCRYTEKLANGGNIVVIEEPPAYRTIKVSMDLEDELYFLEQEDKIKEWEIDESFYRNIGNRPFRFTLAFPYVVFVLMFDRYSKLTGSRAFARTARMSGLGDYLMKLPLLNINDSYYVCLGDYGSQNYDSLDAAVEGTIMVFWSAVFNPDYIYGYEAYKNIAGVNTYIGWQALSQIDPMFIYSVDWIDTGLTIKRAIDDMKEHFSQRSDQTFGYRELEQIFSSPLDSGISVPPSPRSKRKVPLFYDIAQGINLYHPDKTFYLHVRDPIYWGDKIAYIDSFIGFFESDEIKFIRIEREDGKKILVRFTKDVNDYIYEGAKSIRYEEQGILKNGEVIKEGDIIVVKTSGGNKLYKKTYFIRKCRDGLTEARLGNSFYILENIEGEKLNMEAPKLGNLDLQKGEKYIILNRIRHFPFHSGNLSTFDGIDVSPTGRLMYEFQNVDKYNQQDKINLNVDDRQTVRKVYPLSTTKELPPVFRVGRELLCIRPTGEKCRQGYAWATPEGVVHDHNYGIDKPTISDVEEHLIINNGSTFRIESFDLDIEFNIGDKVVYADWQNPINMLIIRTISGFSIDKNNNSLNFVLEDKDGQLKAVEYIGGGPRGRRTKMIHVGKIRKIVNRYERVTAGTKIIANKGYIPHFPKKDVNIIIGFLTDTGGDEPLVLCSNCCTLWYGDMMENFKRVTMRSKKWPTLAHAPIDVTKIKAQPGDIIQGVTDYRNSRGWLVCREPQYRGLRLTSMENYISSPDSFSFDAYMKRQTILDCVPNPRMSTKDQRKMVVTKAWPNFHGLFIESKLSFMHFINDERSILHVQDSCE